MGHRFVYNPYSDYITPSKSRQVQSSLSTPGYCPLRSQQRAKIPSPFHGFTSGKKSIILPSLTVSKRKNRWSPYIYWAVAIFLFFTEYSNLFPSFTFFLNCFHFTSGYELIIRSKITSIMKSIRNRLPFVCWDKSLLLYLDKIHCFQGI